MVLETKDIHQQLSNNNVGVEEDKISNLPDDLIHHILSFLPTKCVMSTSILSKRWNHLSNSITSFDFREWQRDPNCTVEENRLETKRFMDFLDTVFYRHDKPNIKKFSLGRAHNFDKSRLTKWVDIVIKRKVEELSFSEVLKTPFNLPVSFFTCGSLTVLELIGVQFKVPENVSLPRLKLLRLESIQLFNGRDMEKLFSNCPILEELSLIEIKYDSLKSEVLSIANQGLKNLHICWCKFKEPTIKICAPNLTTISYIAELPEELFVVESIPPLVEAVIDICNEVGYTAKKHILIKLFERLSNAKLLKMSADSFLVLSSAEILFTDLPAFNNLIHLEISSTFDFTSFGSVKVLSRFLQRSPNLESIVFAKGIDSTHEDDRCWSFDPECSLLHLRSVKFYHFNGMPKELDAIKLFLKYAEALETVIIVASTHLSRNLVAQTQAMRQLLMFQRPKSCVVEFLPGSENI